ncbi:glycosyl hydrolase family 18 protein [Paenibacillus sp. HB172176]|uniref:glycosyl hydrolase family 18 protein n=1 Tax=Paenibacillus sp. HB172176 TaxID=2493690 RepID=UPI001F0DF145|nr:glycosyl hydrolase family 18 protein [Paenibacillus sp. HB172176]
MDLETSYIRTPRKRRRSFFGILVFLFIIAALASFGWFYYLRYIPSNEMQEPSFEQDNPIVMNGADTAYGAVIEEGDVALPLTLLETVFGEDKPIYYEEQTGTIVLTTANQVLQLKTNALTGLINKSPYQLNIAAQVRDDVVYIPEMPLEQLYGLKIDYDESSHIVTVMEAGDAVQQAKVTGKNGAALRIEPSIRKPYQMTIEQGEVVRLWEEEDGWYLAQTLSGYIGYIRKSEVTLGTIEQVAKQETASTFVPTTAIGQKVNLTWEAVYNQKINTDKIGDMTGLNVVSPTWFELADGKGTIASKADSAYVKWAHERGYQIWALFSNGFLPDQTTEALSTAETRFKMIQQIIAFAELYDLQGINIDFENVYTKDKENLVQFVKELTPLLHEQGLVVSIDVTPKSNSEMWSVFLDRAALGKVVDYMMIMAYDEHWAASPVSGSVASLSWTEQSIAKIMEEDKVPPGKIILSMPLYTRIWTEKADETGVIKVSSKAVGMDSVKQIVQEKKLLPTFDADAGQNYVEYEEDGALKRIWIEDDVSMTARLGLVRKFDLAGVATWQRAFQTTTIWDTISKGLANTL